jgi:phenylacetate-CoA ligase
VGSYSVGAVDGNVFVELVPWRPELPNVFRVNVTTRDRVAMSRLRYFTGDLVRRTPTGYRILGRERDLFINPEGRVISAFEVEGDLPSNFACWHWSLV